MKTIFILFHLIIFTLVGCDKKTKENTPPQDIANPNNPNVPKGTLSMHLHNYLDVTEIDGYNIVYTNAEGRKFSFSKAQLYLSEFELVKLDGTYLPIADKYILKVQENQVYQLGEVPIGNYKSIRFKIGLNETTNQMDGTSSAVLNHPEMWYGSTSQPDGYVYYHLAGKIDTTAAANALVNDMVNFEYKLGGNTQHKQITMPDNNYSIVAGQTEYLHIYIDHNKLLEGVTLINNTNLSVSNLNDNTTSIGIQLGNNLSNLFYYE